MSQHRQRLEKIAEQITVIGLAGGDMQKKLAEIVDTNDLTVHEIQRLAEMANRSVQTGLFKKASDKRFVFKLCDPKPFKEAARKHAESSIARAPNDAEKVAAVLEEMGGDPFAMPYREPENFSLYAVKADPELEYESKTAETRAMLIQLDKARLEVEAMEKQAFTDMAQIRKYASDRKTEAVQAAMDMIGSHITLPSLYEAVTSAVEGSEAREGAHEDADALMLAIIQGLKARGVANHVMGFRYQGDQDEIEQLDAPALLRRCQIVTGRAHPRNDIGLPDITKTSATTSSEQYAEAQTDAPLTDEASQWLSARPSMAGPWQAYLDDKTVSNLPGGAPKLINGENEFVIGVKDLIGARDRMQRLHSANEYIGLKIKQIEEAMRKLDGAQKKADVQIVEYREKKAAITTAGLSKAKQVPVAADAAKNASIPQTNVSSMLAGTHKPPAQPLALLALSGVPGASSGAMA